jgi:hypothetical protein
MSTVAEAFFTACETGEGGTRVARTARRTRRSRHRPPTGRKTSTDYVYVMQFDGDRISHMNKIWHSGLAMKALGWA